MGLGNPGVAFKNTRHNIGWKAVEVFAKRKNLDWEGRNSLVYALGDKFVLVKPITFMNLSGKAVRQAMEMWGQDPEKLIILHDDIDLPLGKVKIKFGGGTAGHRGLESVIYEIGTSQFGRIRMGINIGYKPAKLADFVLQEFSEEEMKIVECSIDRACEAMELIMEEGFEKAMSIINGEKPCSFQQEGAEKPKGGINGN